MYFEELSMHKSINCVSAHQNSEHRSSEKPISAVCIFLFLCGNVHQNQCAFIIVFVLVFELHVSIAFVNYLNNACGLFAQVVLYFMAYKKVGS